MKSLLVFTFLSVAVTSHSQDSSIALTYFEWFNSQPGKALKTEARTIGKTGGWSIAKLKTTDVATGTVVYAVNIDRAQNNFAPIVNSNTLYIDLEELDSVLYALSVFVKESDATPAGPVHLHYITAKDVALTCDYFGNVDRWDFRIGRVYQHLRSPVSNTYITFTKKRLLELMELFNPSQNRNIVSRTIQKLSL